MADDGRLLPFFMPPLAGLLAQAQAAKKGRLTEHEVRQVRDNATCIMMTPEHVEKMVASRGYRDVDGPNCWADWHRLRVQFTGDGYLPKIVLCLVGGPKFAESARSLLEGTGIEHEWRDRHPEMAASFEASNYRIDPSLGPEDVAAIATHTKVLYVLSKNLTAQEAPGAAATLLRLGARLLEAGGTAMKCESAGVAHGRSRWLDLAREADTEARWTALLKSFVQLPIWDKTDFHSCGMHLLGSPDLIVSEALLRKLYGTKDEPAWKAVKLFGVFAHYLLADCPDGRFHSGHTFSLDANSPRFRVVWEECRGYEEDDFFFNPFGRWRFTDASA